MWKTVGLLVSGVLVTTPVITSCGAVGNAGPPGPTVVATTDRNDLTPVRFDHRAGAPAAAVPTVIVRRGSTVVLTVGSDVAGRVLVPEQGRAVDVTAGSTVSIRFIALGVLSVRIAEPGADRGGTVIGIVQPRG